LNAITGVPQAIASINTNPKGSGQAIGASSAMAPLRKLDFSPSLISPIYSTSGTGVAAFRVGDVGGKSTRERRNRARTPRRAQ
jgi:hypothetical protein